MEALADPGPGSQTLGGFGIMLDDVIAAVYAAAVVFLLQGFIMGT